MAYTLPEMRRKLLFAQNILTTNLHDVSAKDADQSPAKEGNNISWQLGHILRSRGGMLQLLQAKPFWLESESRAYASERKDTADYAPAKWEWMIEQVKVSHGRLTAAMENFASWNDPSPWPAFFEEGETIGDHISYLMMHESYHTGQIGLLRRILGKPGRIGPPKE